MTIGLVVGNAASPTTGDALLKTRIESAGWPVAYVDDADAVPTGRRGFVLSATTDAATVGTKYDAVTVPVLTINHNLWDDNRLAANVGASTASSADYDLEAHAVTTGLADPLTVLTAAQAQRGVLNASIAAGGTVVARPGADAGRGAAWVVETGGTLTSGTAPARRAALFLPDAWLPLLTAGGQQLVENLVNWLVPSSFSLMYDAVLSRVRVAAAGLGPAVTARVERSTNQVTWTTVRGGAEFVVVDGAVALDDYEFAANVVNYYRVTWADTITFVATGSAASGNGTSVTPGLPGAPGELQSGDLLLLEASSRNSPTGVPNAPSGYSTLLNASNLRLFGKIATSSESAPTVTFTGVAAGDDTLARMAAFRRAQLGPRAAVQQENASAQNVHRPDPPIDVDADNLLLLHLVWKQDDWTSVTAGTGGFATLGDVVSTAGSDAAQSWSYWVQQARAQLAVSDANVTGGAAAISRSATVLVDPETVAVSGSIEPILDGVWLKSVARPFLNRQLDCVNDVSDVVRPARVGVFDVVGRTLPVGVTDVRGSRRLTIKTITETTVQRQDFELVLASGDVVFVHAPPDDPVPTLYAVIDDVRINRPLRNRRCDQDWRVFELPLVEVAAPGPDVVGSTSTWQTVLDTYASWSAVIVAKATWADLLELVGSPSEVIVP